MAAPTTVIPAIPHLPSVPLASYKVNVGNVETGSDGREPSDTSRGKAANATNTTRHRRLRAVQDLVKSPIKRTNSNPSDLTREDDASRPALAIITGRFGSWTRSALNSPVSSQSTSPPCGGVDRHADSKSSAPSASSSSSSSSSATKADMSGPETRSASVNSMLPTSQPAVPAVEGAGLRARRLSTYSPREFVVDHCELDNEFKRTTIVPFRRSKKLGDGTTAEVRVMSRKGHPTDDLYAVKEFRARERDESEDDYFRKIMSEYTIAKSLHHPNIVETVCLRTHNSRWNHIMEFCPHGELFDLLKKGLFASGSSLDRHYKTEDRLCFFKQLCRGVAYLHDHGIAHRDIKLENLLLDKHGHLKIADFGVSDVFTGEHPGSPAAAGKCGVNMSHVRLCRPGICGSMPYIAPEVLAKKHHYDPRAIDVWSCGIVFCYLSSLNPWEVATEEDEKYAAYLRGWNDFLSRDTDSTDTDDAHKPPVGFQALGGPTMQKLILRMLCPDPDRRISMRDVLSMPVMRRIPCCTPEACSDGPSTAAAAATTPAVSVDVSCKDGYKAAMQAPVVPKHNHLPPKQKKTPKFLQHRFDMGHGWN